MESIQKLAENRGGKCISTVYINSKTKLKFECAKGHIWETQQSDIKRGTWCRKCFYENQNIKVDLTGKKLGRLLVLGIAYTNKWGGSMWNVKCDCGTEKIVSCGNLNNKSRPTRSCGCLNRELAHSRMSGNFKTDKGEVGFNILFTTYKASAKKRGHMFELSKEEFAKLTKMDCEYCGVEPSSVSGYSHNYSASKETKINSIAHSSYNYNGIDRKDNDKGYILNNVVPCCTTCNKAKGELSQIEWIAWLSRLIATQNCKK